MAFREMSWIKEVVSSSAAGAARGLEHVPFSWLLSTLVAAARTTKKKLRQLAGVMTSAEDGQAKPEIGRRIVISY